MAYGDFKDLNRRTVFATALNVKINEVKNNIPSITNSATNASLNA